MSVPNNQKEEIRKLLREIIQEKKTALMAEYHDQVDAVAAQATSPEIEQLEALWGVYTNIEAEITFLNTRKSKAFADIKEYAHQMFDANPYNPSNTLDVIQNQRQKLLNAEIANIPGLGDKLVELNQIEKNLGRSITLAMSTPELRSLVKNISSMLGVQIDALSASQL